MNSLVRVILCVLALALTSHAEDKAGHLFILSGQSNMTGNVKKGFADVVSKTLGDKATIVHHCKPGRGIRFWVSDYQLPEGHPMAGLSNNKSNGEEFPKLVEVAKSAGDATKFKTIHFIWMQGESDANRDLGVAYERSFKVLIERLKKELGIEEIHFVIGRLSDYGLHVDDKRDAWKRMREVQEKLANDDPFGACIDTDDFIPMSAKNPKGDLHYPQEDAVKLGERFGGAALKQLGETSGK